MIDKKKLSIKVGSIAAALAITAVTGFAYTTPSTYVSLDVNPSIEYKLNAFDRVISVVAVNEDGERVVNELDLKNEKIEKAVLKTIEKLKEQGYLTEEDYSGIVIAVSNKNAEKSDELSGGIEEELGKGNEEKEVTKDDEEKELDDSDKEDEDENKDNEAKDEEDIQIVVEAVGRERVEEARKLNVTPGKLNLVQKLIASTDDFDEINEEQLKELLSLSVKEINKMTNAYKNGLDVEFDFENDLEEDEAVETEKVIEDDVKGKEVEEIDNVKNEDDDNKVKEEKEKKNNGKVSKFVGENEEDYENAKVKSNGNNGNNGNNGYNGKK